MDKFKGNLDELVHELNASKNNLARYIKKKLQIKRTLYRNPWPQQSQTGWTQSYNISIERRYL